MNEYVNRVLNNLKKQYAHEPEYLQCVQTWLEMIDPAVDDPRYEQQNIIGRMVEPERTVLFRIPWVDDSGNVHVNKGYRVQFNSAIGPYKGGIRFHPSVNLSIIKFLGMEQILKNSLTSLPIGGGKGGSDFDPKGKSDNEIMSFCQSFMNELYRHIGADTDVPAGDIGVGAREVGYMFGQYKRLVDVHTGVFTGRGLSYGGSLARKEATGFGLCYFTNEMLRDNGKTFEGARVVISGSGNVAIYAAQKATQLGARVVAMSDSDGYVYDENGIDLELMKETKEIRRERIFKYAEKRESAVYNVGCKDIWSVPCDIALPCATQNELDLDGAKSLVKNGCFAIAEGANMPTTPDAVTYLQANGVLFAPAKAANAGGVATSALEMSQNSMRYSWTFDEVDAKLHQIMINIYKNCSLAANEYGCPGNLVAGANISGFLKVAEAMRAQGVV